MNLKYQSGFGNHFSSEVLPSAIPQGQNSPQKVPYGLYAEQISGNAFTANRSENLRTWFYRIRPSVLHSPFKPMEQGFWRSPPFDEVSPSPNQLRWDPPPLPKKPTDFVQGMVTMAGNGDVGARVGFAAHLYAINKPMEGRFFYNADGEMLFIPEQGKLLLRTELGILEVAPGEIAVIPRGIKFQVLPSESTARGYVGENLGAPLRLPNLGLMGANALAHPRDFLSPEAWFEEKDGEFELIAKFQGQLWSTEIAHSPFDVVGWHGNYVPYKYDLSRFQAINTVSYDHPDPSIYTVLTSPSDTPGVANADFVIFPPRWMVAEHSFRPPYFHRNVMSEFMGLIRGVYDAKPTGFSPGGSSLHNCMSAHGPDAETYTKGISGEQKPSYLKDTLAFMFETARVFRPTAFAMKTEMLQKDYMGCWKGLKSNFSRKG